MKTLFHLAAFLAGTHAFLAAAEPFQIPWFTIDGGGSMSTGGAYRLSGTIGQPDAGTLSGGNYTLTGGFWGVVAAIQTDGAPLLRVTRDGTSVVVSWAFPANGFVLQQTTALASTPGASVWTDVTSPTAFHVGADWTITIPSPTGNRFFRLQKR